MQFGLGFVCIQIINRIQVCAENKVRLRFCVCVCVYVCVCRHTDRATHIHTYTYIKLRHVCIYKDYALGLCMLAVVMSLNVTCMLLMFAM